MAGDVRLQYTDHDIYGRWCQVTVYWWHVWQVMSGYSILMTYMAGDVRLEYTDDDLYGRWYQVTVYWWQVMSGYRILMTYIYGRWHLLTWEVMFWGNNSEAATPSVIPKKKINRVTPPSRNCWRKRLIAQDSQDETN